MPGYQATTQANTAQNANNVTVMIGNSVVAFAQTVGHQVGMGTEQLYGVGTSKPQEIQQLRMSPSIALDSFALTSVGINLLAGGVNLHYTLAGKIFELHVMDGLTNTILYTYVGCKAGGFSQSISTNSPVRDSITFLAMDVLNSSGQSIMDAGDNALAVISTAASVAAANASTLGNIVS